MTKYVKASGSSGMIDYLSILGVTQLATAANRLSSTKGEAGSVSTVITADKFENGTIPISKLEGTQITFGTYNSVDSRFNDAITLSLPTSYTTTDPDTGKKITHTIDYTADPKDLVVELNKALDSEDFMAKDKGMGSGIHFVPVSYTHLGLSMREKRVLCIDLDPQGNLGFCLGLDGESGYTVLDLYLIHI